MKLLPRLFAIVAILLAAAIVFSPLVAAIAATGVGSGLLRTVFADIPKPLEKSAGTALVGAIVALVLGIILAILIERSQAMLRRALWAIALLVLMVPPYIVAEASIVLLGPAGKISKLVAMHIGLGPHSPDPIAIARFVVPGFVYSWPMVGIVLGGCFFPIVALAVGSAYRRTDHRVFEAARIARGKRGVFEIGGRILILPALGASLLVFAIALTEFAVPQLLRVRTVGEVIYEQIQEGDLSAAAAISLPLLPLVLAAGVTGALILARSRSASMAGLEGEVPKFSGQTAGVLGNFFAVAASIIAITPGLILPATSLIWLAVGAKLPRPSLVSSHQLLRASGFLESFQGAWDLAHDDAIRTVWLAVSAATLATIFAIVLARLASRAGLGSMLGALGAGLAVPASIVGLGLIVLWNHEPVIFVYQSGVIVVLAWFARFLPVTIFLVQGALARVPRELESAAALAGRGPLQRFVSVVLPNAKPGIIAAWLAMYVLSATEFSATLLVVPAGSPLIAPSVVNLMRRGQDPEIAACQVLLLAVIALPLLPIGIAVFWRSLRDRKGSK
jgi:iron(III) transport system permease protein